MNNEETEEIKRRVDLVEYVSALIPLKRSGRNFTACCPFHREKTPSFFVHPDKQTFTCYGCGKWGDIFSFAMAHFNLTFPEAKRELAQRAGVELRALRPGAAGEARAAQERVARIEKTLALGLEYFRAAFNSGDGAQARAYMLGRGFKAETLERFEIGYAPARFNGLLDWAERRNISFQSLAEAGLAGEKDERRYDFFRERVIFPVRDPGGRLVGFGGRVLGDGQPKYLNSPDSDLFKKGRLFYGLHLALQRYRPLKPILLMEGYTDVMMVEQFGLGPAAAALGTALTEDHMRYLRRFGLPLYLVLDSDEAGRKAASRTLPLLLRHNLNARVVQVPDGKDPCEFLLKNPEAPRTWPELLERAPDAFSFKLQQLMAADPRSGVERRARIAEEMLADLKACGDALRLDLYLEELSRTLEIPRSVLGGKIAQPAADSRPPPPVVLPVESETPEKDSGYYLLAIFLAEPGYLAEIEEQGGLDSLPPSESAQVISHWISLMDGSASPALPEIEALLTPPQRALFKAAATEELPTSEGLRRFFEEKLREIKSPRRKAVDLRKRISDAQSRGNTEELRSLMAELQQITKKSGKKSGSSE